MIMIIMMMMIIIIFYIKIYYYIMSLSIFTWNICWECMTGTNKGSAAVLGKQCYDATIKKTNSSTICLDNVVDILNSLNDYDFIALQEAANWDIIYNKLINKKLKYIHTNFEFVHLVTFYNYNKIKIIGIISGLLNDTSGYDIRPYHIVFCYDKINNKYIIFINLHNGHGLKYKQDNLQDKFNKNINNIIKINKDGNYNNSQKDNYQTFTYIEKFLNDDIYTIIVGDFNDNYGYNYYKGFKPFNKTSLFIKDIIVSSGGLIPPLTCCDTNPLNSKYHSYGDYVLYSSNFISNINNKLYDLDKKLYSDHLPIYSILQYKIISFKNKYLKYKNKYKLLKNNT